MKRDEENLHYAVRNNYKFVLATPEGLIKRFSNDRRNLERYQKDYRNDWRIYTTIQYKNLTK